LLQVLALYEKALGPEHPDIAESLISLAELYQKQEKADESRSLLQRALTIQEKVFGPEHPKTLVTNEQYQSLFP
jgi:tetratricopeptide (TPR) repeat protein